MPEYGSPDSANFPSALANTCPITVVHDDATDRDAATPDQIAGAHPRKIATELRAVQSYVMAVTGLQVTDNGGLEVAFSAGRIRVGNGAPVDVAADVLTVADDDTSYIECAANGTVSDNVVGFTAGAFPMATVVASSGDIASDGITDDRTAYFLVDASAVDHGGLGGLADDDHAQYILATGARPMAGPWSMGDQDLLDVLELRFQATTELTIDTGEVTMTQGVHRIDTEADAGTDDLDTIGGGNDGALLLVRAEDAAHTVVLKHGTGNLQLGGADISLADTAQIIALYYDGTLTKWLLVGNVGSHGTGAALKDHADVAAAVSDSDVQGDIIHRDGTDWTRLAKGDDGQVLKTGASDVAWEDDIFYVEFVIDGGGSAITTGEKGHIEVPAGTILRATALADQSGSIVVDIWKDTYANFPPADGDSITAAAPVTISGATKSQDSTLTDWIKTMADGDILAYNVDSCATIERLAISLKCKRS